MYGANPIRRSVKQRLNGFAACNWKKINDYYQSALTKKVYATATILDPRFKAAFFKGRKDSAAVKKQFLADAQPFSKYEESVNNNNEASS